MSVVIEYHKLGSDKMFVLMSVRYVYSLPVPFLPLFIINKYHQM